MVNNYTTFNVKRKLDYNQYNTPLTDDEFIQILKTECSDWDINTVKLSRTVFTNVKISPLLLVDGSQHELRFHDIRTHNYILLHIIDQSQRWVKAGVPNKYRSIDFWYSKKTALAGVTQDMNHYYIIPFNGAKLANAKLMIGRHMDFIEKKFKKPPSVMCRDIQDMYFKTFDEKIDYSDPETTINCLKRLNEPLQNPGKDRLLNYYKEQMSKSKKEDFPQFLDYCFDPIKNNFKLIDVDYCNTEKPTYGSGGGDFSGYEVGWTDSKVLMVQDSYYKNIIEKL